MNMTLREDLKYLIIAYEEELYETQQFCSGSSEDEAYINGKEEALSYIIEDLKRLLTKAGGKV